MVGDLSKPPTVWFRKSRYCDNSTIARFHSFGMWRHVLSDCADRRTTKYEFQRLLCVREVSVAPQIQYSIDCCRHHVENKGRCTGIYLPSDRANTFGELIPHPSIRGILFGCILSFSGTSATSSRWLNKYRVCRYLLAEGLHLCGSCFWRPHEPESLCCSLNIGSFPEKDRVNAFASMVSHHAYYALWTCKYIFE